MIEGFVTLTHSGSVQVCDTRTCGFGLVHSPVGVCGSGGTAAKGQLWSGLLGPGMGRRPYGSVLRCSALIHASPFGSGPKCALHSFMHHPSALVRSVLCTLSCITLRFWSEVCSALFHASPFDSGSKCALYSFIHLTLGPDSKCDECITLSG